MFVAAAADIVVVVVVNSQFLKKQPIHLRANSRAFESWLVNHLHLLPTDLINQIAEIYQQITPSQI